MWYAIYMTATGVLVSGTTVEPTSLPATQAYKTYASKPADTMMWDPATRDYIARPPAGVVDRMTDLETRPEFADFQAAFGSLTNARKQQIRNSITLMLGIVRYRDTNESVIIG
jgi:hypothetical protein